MKRHDIELAKMLHNVESYIKSLEETNDHFSTQIGKLTGFLMTNDINPLKLGRSSIDIAIDEIKRIQTENERLKKDNAILYKQNIKVQTKGM
ncbi:hypothetical protein SAMN05421839_1397 [Halolactibacillus halophilus]|uniref:Uncharacterized protein n=1 Tax=Halolactibacillus halophilus TaxID=306540 RepID=A0A1I5S4K2_9BACI|nr:hypothetical protein [Halolactibacillus halophilus]GEM02963.1 hypothetical protein HHA03_24950 [Halolactibacillus halophilus]SFP65629.1 hypothetical protein SAMN05421839_1397 [Halolactibacillus halophilus]